MGGKYEIRYYVTNEKYHKHLSKEEHDILSFDYN